MGTRRLGQRLEALHNDIRSTRPHWMRRILEEFIQPNRSRLWKDLTIFRFDLLQANQIRPEDNWPKPRHPEHQSNHYVRDAFILPWASKHRIRRIYSCPHLPNLESLAFKLQNLYSLECMDVISTFQAAKKIPKKLSYPLKPSRFKITQAPPLQAKIPMISPTEP